MSTWLEAMAYGDMKPGDVLLVHSSVARAKVCYMVLAVEDVPGFPKVVNVTKLVLWIEDGDGTEWDRITMMVHIKNDQPFAQVIARGGQ